LNYQPKPIDTSKVTLTTEHLKLTELLAKNTHELWSQQRIAEGWKYGEKRDDVKKEHPCLVPYEDLPDSEKEYDRRTALGAIKTFLALGYRIEGNASNLSDYRSWFPTDSDQGGLIEHEQKLAPILESLKKSSDLNLASLLQIKRETINLQPKSPDLYRTLGDSILRLGEPLMAYDVLAEGLQKWPNDVRLQQLMALALARSGATNRANSMLLSLVESGNYDEETISLLARSHKDLWLQANTPEEKQEQLKLAAKRYKESYQITDSYYPGINAATMAMLMGNKKEAETLALEVRDQCLSKLQPAHQRTSDSYWLLATLGETALILQQFSEGQQWYAQAVKLAEKRFGDLSSTRRNATLLLQHLKGDVPKMRELFPIPRVAVFSGHMIDSPDRNSPRFPAPLETEVFQAIRDRLQKLEAHLGYASAACGADILFLEAILELGGEAHVVLPYEREQFIKESVDIIPGSNWVKRFNRVLEQATEVIVPSHQRLEDGNVVYEYANRLLHGLAKMRAEQLETDLIPLAVWDGKPGGVGGTASVVEDWQAWGYQVELIDLSAILSTYQQQLKSENPLYTDKQTTKIVLPQWKPPAESIQTKPASCERQIVALLFADVVQFSRLTEDRMLPFLQNFLGEVANLMARSPHAPVMKNTWEMVSILYLIPCAMPGYLP
jgi:tetratricopeptide (TPR) repeat protein